MYNIERGTGKFCSCGGEIVQKFGTPCILVVPGEESPIGCSLPNAVAGRDDARATYRCAGCRIEYHELPK